MEDTGTIKLNGWETRHVKDVELSVSDVIDAVIKVIRRKRNLRNVDGHEQGRLHEHVEYATSHSWINKEDRGPASKEQIEALDIISFLERIKRA